MDVFQLLLQLSDTMLDINTQLNNNQSSLNFSQAINSNQLFPLNTFMNSDANNFLYEEEENQEDDLELEELNTEEKNELIKKEIKQASINNANDNNASSTSKIASNISNINSTSAHKTNVIEEFLHKTLNTSHSTSNSLRISSPSNSTAGNSSISNIINSLNNRNHSSVSRNGSFFTTPSQSFRSTLTTNKSELSKPLFNKPLNLNSTDSSSSASSPSSVANLIENIYDKTSVTLFVDALLNQNPGAPSSTCKSKTQSINSIDETSNISDCCYSTLSSTTTTHNTEPVYQSIDPEFMNSSSLVSKKQQQLSTVATTLTTSQILARQPSAKLVSSKQHQSFNLKKANSIYATNQMKSSQSNCSSSSSSSSSSGCGGSSSICSSSNTDLTYMAAENNGIININRNSTSSTSSSVLASPLSCLSASSSNNEIINQVCVKKTTPEHLPVRAYESSCGSSGSSSSSNSPQNSLISGSSGFSYSSNSSSSATLNQYKRSNSVNYKSMNNTNQLPTASTSSIANRKPSFKFESNILNKVQFMNSNKTNEQKNNHSHSVRQTASPLKSLNEVTIPSQSLLKQQDNCMNKRNSLGREEIFEQSQKLIKRQQSVNSHKSFQNQPNFGQLRALQQMNISSSASNSGKSPASPSIILNQIKMNQHQMSLDSGIFLPSETEEYNSFNLNIVR